MNDVENKAKEIISKYGSDVIKRMIVLSKTEGSNFANGLSYSVQSDLSLILSIPEYGQYIESGRKAGATPPPVDSLTSWMSRKGIPEEYKYGIAINIGRNGVEARPFMSAIDELADTTYQSLTDLFVQDAINTITEPLNNK